MQTLTLNLRRFTNVFLETEFWLLSFTKNGWSLAYSFNNSAYYEKSKTTYLIKKTT